MLDPKGTSQLEPADLEQLKIHGKTSEEVKQEVRLLQQGAPYAKLKRACSIEDGILGPSRHETHIRDFEAEAARGRAQKFVAASGAASRMFAAQQAILGLGWSRREVLLNAKQGNSQAEDCLHFLKNLQHFAFYEVLAQKLAEQGFEITSLLKQGRIREILRFLLGREGLNYAELPKGFVLYHRYPDRPRTAFEEHLVEAEHYLKDEQGLVRLHFTVPPGTLGMSKGYLVSAASRLGNAETQFEVSVTEQKSSTDTIALNSSGQLLRTPDGRLALWPGGHGSLLANLNDLKGDIVFVRTIDNVLPDRQKPMVSSYKKLLGGILVSLQRDVFRIAEQLEKPGAREAVLREAEELLQARLSRASESFQREASLEVRRRRLFQLLNRPLRVCGVVRHKGEPGGGPFWVEGTDGETSLQFVERSQVDFGSPSQTEIWESCQFFNPADLVCGIRDFRGRPFDLFRFRDPIACFTSRKWYEGRAVTTLELPGLWNGGMAFWNTVFVKIPRETFHPVKNVLDLLSLQHQTSG